MKCPICRQDASATVKLIYDIKYAVNAVTSGDQSSEDEAEVTMDQVMKENFKYKRINETLKHQIKDMTDNYKQLTDTIDEYIQKFKDNEKRTKEYKQQLLMLNVKVNEEKAKNEMLCQDIEELKSKNNDLEKVKKELELQLGVNKEMNEFISEINQKEKDVNLKERYIDIMSKNDGGRTLSEYFYVLEERVKRLTKENEELKRKKYENDNAFGGEFKIKEFVNKRKYNEYKESAEKKGNENKGSSAKERTIINNSNNKNNNNNNNAKSNNTLFMNPLTMTKGLSFIQKK